MIVITRKLVVLTGILLVAVTVSVIYAARLHNTYRNQKYGFAVTYPKDWAVREESQSFVSFAPEALRDASTYLLFIQVFDLNGQKSLKDYYEHLCDSDLGGCAEGSNRFALAETSLHVKIGNTEGVKFVNVGGAAPTDITAFIWRQEFIVEIGVHKDFPQAQQADIDKAYDEITHSFSSR
jgi:hypothetical protein